MTLVEATYSSGQVAKAIGVNEHTLQTWFKRGLVTGGENAYLEKPSLMGTRRRFTFENVVEVAVANAPVCLRVPAPVAFRAARQFAHVGDEHRLPGLPFPDGPTFLFSSGPRASVIRWCDDTYQMLAAIKRRLGTSEGFIALDVGPVFDRAVAGLGLHPQDVIDAAYAGFTVRPQVAPSLVHQQ